MAITKIELMNKSRAELDELYLNSSMTAMPAGDGRGTAVIAAGTWLAKMLAVVIGLLAWQGKVFYPQEDYLLNKILPLQIRAIKAQVYKGNSWLDGKEAWILDYSKTSVVAQKIRDEIREVAPGIYLGKVYWGNQRTPIDFILEFSNPISS
jgi:hypothetical protein